MSLFDTGPRPLIDAYLLEESKKLRDYGEFWSASSAGYCMRKNIFERLKVPHIEKEGDARKTRVFESGKIFHEWVQRITKDAGVSIAQELELQDEDLKIRGHIDDLLLIDGKLVLVDYKTQNSRAFTYQKGRPISYYHKMQLGTYMYMLRRYKSHIKGEVSPKNNQAWTMGDWEMGMLKDLTEARILKISKDDLRMDENQLLWSPELESEVLDYWNTLNAHWKAKTLPKCSCHVNDGGFMASPKYNPYFFEGEPCSLELYKKWKVENAKV